MADGGERRAAALVVGVGEYPAETVGRLAYAATDARAVADRLVRLGRFPADKVKLLQDEDAGREAVLKHLTDWLPKAAEQAELVFLYFAGHGTTVPVNGQPCGFYLPHGADPDNPLDAGVGMALVAGLANGLPAAAVVLCLDCCYAGTAVTARGGPPAARDMAVRPAALRPLFANAPGRYVWTACDENQSSFEAADLGHGVFTHFLLDELDAADDGAELDALFNRVAGRVTAYAAGKKVQQRPRKLVDGPGDVYLVERRAGRAGSTAGPAVDLAATAGGSQAADPLTAVRVLGVQLAAATDPDEKVRLLDRLRRLARPSADTPASPAVVREAVPLAFAHLADPSEKVREAAQAVYAAVGVTKSCDTLVRVARAADPGLFGRVLAGLRAIDNGPVLVDLLDRLTDELTGDLLRQADELLAEKREGLGLAGLADQFRKQGSKFPPTRVLGQGLFATAYAAAHTDSGREMVVRVLRDQFVHLPDVRRQFRDLAMMAMNVDHQNLVNTKDMGELTVGGRRVFYTVRSFVDGPTLREMLKNGHRFTPGQVAEVMRQVLAGLTAVHKKGGGGHGGVKPSNVFVCDVDDDRLVVLGDPTPPPQGMGQVMERRLAYDYRYLAPEVTTAAPVGPPADVYAVGCLAFELLTGDPPFTGDNWKLLAADHEREPVPAAGDRRAAAGRRPGVGPRADAYLRWLLAKKPADRPTAAAALARVADLTDAPAPPPAGDPARPAPARPLPSAPSIPLREVSLARYKPIVSALSIGPSQMDASRPSLPPLWASDPPSDPNPTGGPPAAPRPADPPTEIVPPERPAQAADSASVFRPADTGPGTQAQERPPDRTGPGVPEESYAPGTMPPRPADRADPGVPEELYALNQYTNFRLIGRGGMGEVYVAHNRMLGRLEALKVIRRYGPDDARQSQRFHRELQLAASLNHPNVVTAYGAFELDGTVVFAMEYLRGQDLGRLVRERGPLPVNKAVGYAYQVAQGLQHAHEQGLIHRDIKPHNLMLVDDGRRQTVKILDFGLAKAADREVSVHTGSGVVLGTPQYMPPEQFRDASRVDIRGDLYALGGTLFYLLTGRPPFEGSDWYSIAVDVIQGTPPRLTDVRPDVPAGLADVVARLLAKKPDDRYPTPEAAAAALKPYLADRPSSLEFTSFDPFPSRPADTPPQAAAPPPAESVWARLRRWFGG